ncbi:MAG: hypothetical protein C0485_00850 [Pirellula sp.]|nr:hypothetical protein [Pirellula sp.]
MRTTSRAAWSTWTTTLGTAAFATATFRRSARATIARTASFATFRATSFTPPTLARATIAALAKLLATKLARLFAFLVVQFAILIGVETLQHPLVHFFAIRTAFALSRGRLVGWLPCFVVRLRDAC